MTNLSEYPYPLLSEATSAEVTVLTDRSQSGRVR